MADTFTFLVMHFVFSKKYGNNGMSFRPFGASDRNMIELTVFPRAGPCSQPDPLFWICFKDFYLLSIGVQVANIDQVMGANYPLLNAKELTRRTR